MESSPPPLPSQRFCWLRAFLSLGLLVIALVLSSVVISRSLNRIEPEPLPSRVIPAEGLSILERIDREFETAWEKDQIEPAPEADELTLIRRLSLALTGAPPSLEEIQQFQQLPELADPVQSWLDHLAHLFAGSYHKVLR